MLHQLDAKGIRVQMSRITGPSPLFFALALCLSTGLAVAAQRLTAEAGGMIAGDLVFALCFAGLCASFPSAGERYDAAFVAGFLIAAFLFTALFVIGAGLGPATARIGELLQSPMTAVGFARPTADAGAPLLGILWAAEVLPLALGALLAGRVVRHFLAADEPKEVSEPMPI